MARFGQELEKLTFTNIVLFVVLSLVLLQGIALVVGGTWGESIKLGPVFVLMALAMCSTISVALVKKLLDDNTVDAKDMAAVFVTIGISLVAMFMLRQYVPEVFAGALVEIQSFLGF